METQAPRDQAKLVIAHIVREAGGTLQNKTNLFKAFYYAHRRYVELYGADLTLWPIVRMPNGPGIDDADSLLSEIGSLTVDEVDVGPHTAKQFTLTEDPAPLGSDALEAIAYGVKMVLNRTAANVSDQSHADSEDWRVGRNGDRLLPILDTISPAERDDILARSSRLARIVGR